MAKTHQAFPFELMLMSGDNLYGSERPQDYAEKFEKPYKPLLDARVKFYAALGNHDDRNQRYYKQFNMDGQRYYSFKAPRQNVRFFALESTYPEPEQIEWLEKELKDSGMTGRSCSASPAVLLRRPARLRYLLREILEPLFIKYNVSVVFTGHDHFYERIKPQKGIAHFVLGSGGQLSVGDIDRAVAADREGLRHRPGVPGGRGRRRSDVLQRGLPDRPDRRFGNHRAAPAAVSSLARSRAQRPGVSCGGTSTAASAASPKHRAGQSTPRRRPG